MPLMAWLQLHHRESVSATVFSSSSTPPPESRPVQDVTDPRANEIFYEVFVWNCLRSRIILMGQATPWTAGVFIEIPITVDPHLFGYFICACIDDGRLCSC